MEHSYDSLLQQVESLHLLPADVADRIDAIRATVLKESKCITSPDFKSIALSDLESIYQLYDHYFFSGLVAKTLGSTPLEFELSGRLTRSAVRQCTFEPRPNGF